MKSIIRLCFLIGLSSFCLDVSGQAGITYDLKKPEKYENIQLASEKPTDKKIKLTRHFIQNTITHYNYYFNANNKLNDVIARAKAQNRDDYDRLLPFYNYSLDVTSKDKKELDSVIYKVTAGVLIHDLRNDWDDNLFVLMGEAYFFRKDLDTAYTIFQFINYAFSPKQSDGYDIPIASNANHDEGGNAFNVSTNENRPAIKRMLSLPPSRNDALIWQVKTFLAMDQITRAGILIQTLRHDPQFPARLIPDFKEVQALWFYKQNMYDSAAVYLQQALGNAVSKLELSRWEYLIAQLYERSGKSWKAREFYEKVVQQTYDPVMEVYARLNAIRQTHGTEPEYIQKNLEALEKMAHKDVYAGYRDIIYFTAAEIELENNQKAPGIGYLLKTVKFASANSPQRSKAFVMLGNMAFDERKYKSAKNYYDSINVFELRTLDTANILRDRKAALGKIVPELIIIEREDSLQRVAAMSEIDRTAYIKKILKGLLKQQGSKDEDDQNSAGGVPNSNNNSSPIDLFNTGSENVEWYFYNPTLKSKGFNDFKTKWGNRENVDDWFLTSLASKQRTINANRNAMMLGTASENISKTAAPTAVTFASLLANLPITPEKLKKSRDSVENALFALGRAFKEDLPDYNEAINAYDSLLQRFPETHWRAETFFDLYYCYKKAGDEANAARMLELMRQHYPDGKYKELTRDSTALNNQDNEPKTVATRQYEKIYNSFIEGDFEGALAQKKAADSIYGEKYWTPQLLYIESVYFIQKKEDGKAVFELNNIVNKYPGTPMALKAKNLVSVLVRRKEIEAYLTNLKIERIKDDSVVVDNAKTPNPRLFIPDTAQSSRKGGDSAQIARARMKIKAEDSGKKQQADSAVAMQKINLYKNQLAKIKYDSAQLINLQHQFDSIGSALKLAGNDTSKIIRLRAQMDSVQTALKKVKSEFSQLSLTLPSLKSSYLYTPSLAHSVAIILTKVDPVYVTETGNAFNRYNREIYYNKTFEISNLPLNDSIRLVLINGFDSAGAAINYIDQAKKVAPREIVPWLPAGKYYFLIITDQNLEILKTTKDISAYRKFLETNFPGKL